MHSDNLFNFDQFLVELITKMVKSSLANYLQLQNFLAPDSTCAVVVPIFVVVASKILVELKKYLLSVHYMLPHNHAKEARCTVDVESGAAIVESCAAAKVESGVVEPRRIMAFQFARPFLIE